VDACVTGMLVAGSEAVATVAQEEPGEDAGCRSREQIGGAVVKRQSIHRGQECSLATEQSTRSHDDWLLGDDRGDCRCSTHQGAAAEDLAGQKGAQRRAHLGLHLVRQREAAAQAGRAELGRVERGEPGRSERGVRAGR